MILKYIFNTNLLTYVLTILENRYKQKVNQSPKKELEIPIVSKNEFKDINSTKNGNLFCKL